MEQSTNDSSNSWVEELDPEPTTRGRREGPGQRRELILGLVMLLAVVGWASWQWWSQARNESEYSLGVQAMAANNLEEAEAHFGAVSDYKDAGSRAQALAVTIAQRDREYTRATEASNSQSWLATYAAAQQVVAIQPGYRDARAILSQAKEHVYTDAFSGTVISRMDASPPGLYYREGDRWVWLEGSDIRSAVRGTGPKGQLVYDVPGNNRARTFNIDPAFWLDGSGLMLASFTGGGVTFHPLSFDPALYNFYIWGHQGIWAFRQVAEGRSAYVFMPGEVRYSVSYEEYGSPVVKSLRPMGSRWEVMDFAPDGKNILLANIGDYSSNNPIMQLYIADGDGTNLRFLYTHSGRFSSAQFGPDSSYVLLSTTDHMGYNTTVERQAVTLIDVTRKSEPIELANADIDLSRPEYIESPYNSAVISTFLRSGKYAGHVLLVEYGAGATSISVIDPERVLTDVVHKWTILGDLRPFAFTWSGEVANDEGLLVVLTSTPAQGNAYLTVVWDRNAFGANNDGDHEPALNWMHIDLQNGEVLRGVWLRDSYLIYVTARAGEHTLYSRRLSFASSEDKPTTVAANLQLPLGPASASDSETLSMQPDALPWKRSVVFGPGLMVYADPGSGDFGQRVVNSYDGALAVRLDDKGYRMYDWSQYELYRGLR